MSTAATFVRRIAWAAATALLAAGAFLWLLGRWMYLAAVLFRALALPLGLVAASALAVLWLERRRSARRGRRRAAVALASSALLAASCALGEGIAHARPAGASAAGTGMPVTLVTYNVLFRGGDPAESLRLLRRHPSDVLALQEVTPAWLARLDAALGATHPHRSARAVPGTHGLAVYSRFPLGEPVYLKNLAGRAVAQCLPVSPPGSTFLLCNVHLASPAAALSDPTRLGAALRSNAEVRAEQWRDLRRVIARRFAPMRGRLIVAGDLNTLPSEPLYDEIRRELVDAFRDTRWTLGATFPVGVAPLPRPLARIDYVLVSPSILPVRARVLPPSGSDHLAVVATLRVGPGPEPP